MLRLRKRPLVENMETTCAVTWSQWALIPPPRFNIVFRTRHKLLYFIYNICPAQHSVALSAYAERATINKLHHHKLTVHHTHSSSLSHHNHCHHHQRHSNN